MTGSGGVAAVHVVGAGLMGTSLALALRAADVPVTLEDRDLRNVAIAVDLGAGTSGPPDAEPAVVFVAVDPADVVRVVLRQLRLYPSATVSDVASVKSHVQREIQAEPEAERFVGGHPLSGRERSGASGARSDLFVGRPWVLTPDSSTDTRHVERIKRLVEACGAYPVVMDAAAHDDAVAAVSHVPQVLASLGAARLLDIDEVAVALAGQGVRDVTRVAASDAALWTQILAANAAAVSAVLDRVAADLDSVRTALAAVADTGLTADEASNRQVDKARTVRRNAAASALRDVLARGQRGRARIAGKHGRPATPFVSVPVVVPDRPGELARLFVAAGEAGVNVEDVSIEHSPGQAVGLVELAVAPDAAPRLAEALGRGGWTVHI